MKVIVCDSYDQISKEAAAIVLDLVRKKPSCVLGLATGSSPIGMYAEIAAANADFSGVTTFNLDEYYPISKDNDQSYHYFMNEHFYSKVNLKEENIHIPSGETCDPEKECKNYDEMLEKAGGTDLQILGIGKNGHIGFNEPGESLICETHVTGLTQSTIEANSRFFDSEDDVPKKALTMGIGAILKSKKIVILASGKDKAYAVKELLKGEIKTSVPATVLNAHPDVTLICDREAYAKEYRLGIDIGGTNTKFGVFDGGEIVFKTKIKTELKSADALADTVAKECEKIFEKYPCEFVGVGVPGTVIGGVVTADNLPLSDTPLKAMLEERLKMNIKISNDANCAGLAEVKCGAGKKYASMVMLTLGTGVGGSLSYGGELLLGNGNMAELGHMIIEANGRKCPCGQSGCFEQYASVTALVRMAENAAKEHADSILFKNYSENGSLDGEKIFDAARKSCPVALDVIDKYTDYLAVGIDSMINVFDPDAVVLSGGITEQGDCFLDKIRAKIHFKTPIVISDLKSDAGITGAALI